LFLIGYEGKSQQNVARVSKTMQQSAKELAKESAKELAKKKANK
jgi:hypothetical protein